MLFSFLLSLVVAAILIQVAVIGTTIYLHRSATHRALDAHPAVAFVFRFSLWLTTGPCDEGVGGGPPEASRVHRRRRRSAQPAADGLLVRPARQRVPTTSRKRRTTDVIERYARDINEDWWDRTFFKRGLLGLAIGTGLLCADRVWWALLAAGIHAVMYVFVLSSSINGLCHSRRLQELRQHRDQPPLPGAADRRRRSPQQPSRHSAQPEVQLRNERNRSRVADHQAAHCAAWPRRTRRSRRPRRKSVAGLPEPAAPSAWRPGCRHSRLRAGCGPSASGGVAGASRRRTVFGRGRRGG